MKQHKQKNDEAVRIILEPGGTRLYQELQSFFFFFFFFFYRVNA
jgi:hypothetical protein